MRFLLTLHGEQTSWGAQTPSEHEAEMSGFAAFESAVRQAGVWVASLALHPVEQAVTVRRSRSEETGLADGPVGASGPIGACYLLECADREQAAAWAQQIPLVGAGGFTAVEVRPVLGESGEVTR